MNKEKKKKRKRERARERERERDFSANNQDGSTISKEWEQRVGSCRSEEAVCRPLCSLGKSNWSRARRGSQSRAGQPLPGSSGQRSGSQSRHGLGNMFLIRHHGTREVITWVYKPHFLRTLSPSQCPRRWCPTPTMGCRLWANPDRSLSIGPRAHASAVSLFHSAPEGSFSPNGHLVPLDGAPAAPGSRLVTSYFR